MKWIYKVVPVEELFQEHIGHDIAVLKSAASGRRAKLGNGFEDSLNELGQEGWELVAISGDFGIFKKQTKD